MSEDMSPSGSSWNIRHLASASSRLKGYIIGHADPSLTRHAWRSPSTDSKPRGLEGSLGSEHERQSWRAWAGQKIRSKPKGSEDIRNTEVINVFPGWAARRYAQGTISETPRPFEVEVFVSGYAISYRSPENITRSQKAFIRLAKGFASLPKLIEDPDDQVAGTTSLVQLTPSTEALLAQVKLPPRPSDDLEIEALERQLKRAAPKSNTETPYSGSLPSSCSSSASSLEMPNDPLSSEARNTTTSHAHPQTTPVPSISSASDGISSSTPTEVLRRLHTNLEQRLQPFWSSALPNRTIRLHLFISPHSNSGPAPTPSHNASQSDKFTFDPDDLPLASQDVVTGANGSFNVKFRLRWDELCHHPQALHVAFCEDLVEHDVIVVAQLLPPASIPTVANAQNQGERSSTSPSYDPTIHTNQIPQPPKPLSSISVIPITHSPIRVISDIDDTIKLSNIVSGARAVFHNVFVKELRDSVIPGMGEWYREMWNKGVRFHYVSNGPFELLPILNEFFQISELPPGSIKLKSYAGRSLFTGLLSDPAARKHAGLVDILDSFPDSQFFLIGDTGEQDLELYSYIARERPNMILGVLVRDVDSGNAEREPLDDPTGWKVMSGNNTAKNTSTDGTTSTSPGSPSNPNFDMNFMSNSHLELCEEENEDGNITVSEQTPRPNRHMLEDNVFEGEETLLVDGNLSGEPGSLAMGSRGDSMSTKSQAMALGASSARSQTYPLESHRLHQQKEKSMPPSPPLNENITQSPRITSNFFSNVRLSPSSQSLPQRIYRHSSTTSTTDSVTTSFSLNSNGSYGGANVKKMTEVEKRRYELQMRVYKARTQMPSHIILRIFRDPRECVEVEEAMRREAELS